METNQIVSREQILDLLIKSGYNPVQGLYPTWEEMKDDFFTKNHLGQDGVLHDDLHHKWVVLVSVLYTGSVFPELYKGLDAWPEEATKLCDSVYLQYTWKLVDEPYVNTYGEETIFVNNPDLVWIGQKLYEHYQNQK